MVHRLCAMASRAARASVLRAILFTDSSETTQMATSASRVVYVVDAGRWSRVQSCNRPGQRPVCHQRLHLRVTVPPSTLRLEQRKRFHLYFGLSWTGQDVRQGHQSGSSSARVTAALSA